MGGSSENSFVEPLGYMLLLTALIALTLSYAKQSTIVAFIAAGAALNAGFGSVVDPAVLGHFSEVGILVLLFMAGLEVELAAFVKAWRTVTIVGMGQIVACTACSALLSLAVLPAVGASKIDGTSAVYFGLCMTFSSTILVLGYLKHSKSMSTVYGQLCLGTLVLQDAASVLGLAVLGGLSSSAGSCAQFVPTDCAAAGTDWGACQALGSACMFQNQTAANTGSRRMLLSAAASSSSSASSSAGHGCLDACASLLDALSCAAFLNDNGNITTNDTVLHVCAFQASGGSSIVVNIVLLFAKLLAACVILAILAKFVLPRLFESFARSLELLYIGTLGYTFGCAAIAVSAGFSAEITAFLAGVSIAQLPYKMHIESKMEPIKSLGVEIFFLALGLQLNLDQAALDALPVAIGLSVFKLVLMLPLFMLLGYCARLKSHNVFMLGLYVSGFFCCSFLFFVVVLGPIHVLT
jgi:Kef-type K+ transport system membrane component KefB